jgi:hypothetical protein
MVSFTACTDQEAQEALEDNGYAYTDSSVTTPNGSSVYTKKYTEELNDDDYDIAESYQQDNYPSVTILRNPTNRYNCHSYAWYSTSTTNVHWMPYPTPYMTDGSYTQVGTAVSLTTIPSAISNSSKVVWLQSVGNNSYLPIHSGIKYSSTLITSKWGAMGLYRHSQGYTPYHDDTSAIVYYV